MMYLIQVNTYAAIMLLAYILLLRNKPMYGFNRVYLLLSAVLPFLLPFIRLPLTIQDKMQTIPALQYKLPEVTVGAGTISQGMSISALAWLIYGLVCLSVILYHMWGLLRLQRVVHMNKQEQKGSYILMKDTGYGPGSFGRYIFFPGNEVNDAILAHELAHIKLHHTRDILFLSFFQAFAWPSLLLGRIKRELKELHEFQADAMANEDKQSYAQLLLSSALGIRSLPEMHLFIIHPLKRRIMMLQKNGSESSLKTILLVSSTALLLGAAVLFVQGCNKSTNKTADNNTPKLIAGGHEYTLGKDAKIDGSNPEPTIYSLVNKMPEAPYNLSEYLGKNIQYPVAAKNKHIEGRVVVRFVVDRDGIVTDPQILRSPDTLLSTESLRVVSNMPKWIPGEQDGKKVSVYFTLPIVFKLQ